jgi:hypothetical protein
VLCCAVPCCAVMCCVVPCCAGRVGVAGRAWLLDEGVLTERDKGSVCGDLANFGQTFTDGSNCYPLQTCFYRFTGHGTLMGKNC